MKKFSYNPFRDLHSVDPASAGVDLRAAYVNNSVPSNISGAELGFNDAGDASSMMTRPADVFEQYRQRDYVQSALKGRSDSVANTTPSGEN